MRSQGHVNDEELQLFTSLGQDNPVISVCIEKQLAADAIRLTAFLQILDQIGCNMIYGFVSHIWHS